MEWTEAKQTELRIILARIKFCGCGSNRKWLTMRQLLENAESHARSFYDDDDLPQTEVGFWEFAANCLDSFELIEHGTSIGYAWLTDDGKLLLQFLQDFPDCKWPEWAEGYI